MMPISLQPPDGLASSTMFMLLIPSAQVPASSAFHIKALISRMAASHKSAICRGLMPSTLVAVYYLKVLAVLRVSSTRKGCSLSSTSVGGIWSGGKAP